MLLSMRLSCASKNEDQALAQAGGRRYRGLIKTPYRISEGPPQLAVFLFVPIMLQRRLVAIGT